jgi:hypothetical protein
MDYAPRNKAHEGKSVRCTPIIKHTFSDMIAFHQSTHHRVLEVRLLDAVLIHLVYLRHRALKHLAGDLDGVVGKEGRWKEKRKILQVMRGD